MTFNEHLQRACTDLPRALAVGAATMFRAIELRAAAMQPGKLAPPVDNTLLLRGVDLHMLYPHTLSVGGAMRHDYEWAYQF